MVIGELINVVSVPSSDPTYESPILVNAVLLLLPGRLPDLPGPGLEARVCAPPLDAGRPRERRLPERGGCAECGRGGTDDRTLDSPTDAAPSVPCAALLGRITSARDDALSPPAKEETRELSTTRGGEILGLDDSNRRATVGVQWCPSQRLIGALFPAAIVVDTVQLKNVLG